MPFVRSESIQFMRGLGDAILAALSARPPSSLLDTPTVHLFTATTGLSMDSAIADFTECLFDGYAATALPAVVGPINTQEQQLAVHGEVDFNGASPQTHPESVAGYYVTNGGNSVLYAAERFPTLIPVANPGDFISLDCILPVDMLLETNQ